MPKISVILPVYNASKYLIKALESLSNQTFNDFEIITINDGSTDNSLELLEEYAKKEPRLRIISRENKGITRSLNEGIDLAKGEYIARMDSDDISLPQRFEKQLNFMSVNNLDVCGTQYERFGTKIGFSNMPINCKDCYYKLLLGTAMAHPSILIKKSVIEKYMYNESIKYAQDYDLWCRMALDKIKMGNTNEVLLKYRFSSDQISSAKNILQISYAQATGKNYWQNSDLVKDLSYPYCVIDSLNNNYKDLKITINSLLELHNRIKQSDYMRKFILSLQRGMILRLSVYGLNSLLPLLKKIPDLNNKYKYFYSLIALTRAMIIKEKIKRIIPSNLRTIISNILYNK